MLLLLPFLAASLSVTNLRAKRGAVVADEEPTVHRDEAERGALDGRGDPSRWRRSLPSLTAPWTSVVEELSRDPDTEIPQHVQVRKLPSLTVVIPCSGPAGRPCLLHVPHVLHVPFVSWFSSMCPPCPPCSGQARRPCLLHPQTSQQGLEWIPLLGVQVSHTHFIHS